MSSEILIGLVFLAVIVAGFIVFEINARKNQPPKVKPDPNNSLGNMSLEEAVRKAAEKK